MCNYYYVNHMYTFPLEDCKYVLIIIYIGIYFTYRKDKGIDLINILTWNLFKDIYINDIQQTFQVQLVFICTTTM